MRKLSSGLMRENSREFLYHTGNDNQTKDQSLFCFKPPHWPQTHRGYLPLLRDLVLKAGATTPGDFSDDYQLLFINSFIQELSMTSI